MKFSGLIHPCTEKKHEAFEKRSILLKVKPPALRAYAPEGKAETIQNLKSKML
jgi:hypothetical protein